MEFVKLTHIILFTFAIYDAIRAGVGAITLAVAMKEVVLCWFGIVVFSIIWHAALETLEYHYGL